MNTEARKRMQTLELLRNELTRLRDIADAEQLEMVAYLIEAAIAERIIISHPRLIDPRLDISS